MTDLGSTSAYPPTTGTTGATGTDSGIKDKAVDTKETAKQAGADVAQTAQEKAHEVVDETKRQARNLMGETRDQLQGQVNEQHRNLISQLRSLANELSSMANGTNTMAGSGGVATELVSQAGDRAHQLVGWLESRQPNEVVDDVRRFARQHPGAFLAGAAIAGVVAGRLTRGVVAAHSEQDTASTWSSTQGDYPANRAARTYPAPSPTPYSGTESAVGYQPTTTTGAFPVEQFPAERYPAEQYPAERYEVPTTGGTTPGDGGGLR